MRMLLARFAYASAAHAAALRATVYHGPGARPEV